MSYSTSFTSAANALDSSPLTTREHWKYSFKTGRSRLLQVVLRDQSDVRGELVEENEWLLFTCESELLLQGNVFVLEDVLDESGTVFVKLAPLPSERATKSDWDIRVNGVGHLELYWEDGYEWKVIRYDGGKWGRIVAMHAFQRQIRPYDPQKDGLLLTNTWGDAQRDLHLGTSFMEREIECAHRLGAEVVQIDGGWHQGSTRNLVASPDDGIWNGFWASDPNFWEVNREKFVDGLKPISDKAQALSLRLGLWFAPDSSNEAASWESDADMLLRLHRELGVDFFKIDAIKITTPQSEANFKNMFAKVDTESHGAITCDLDITDEDRFGYFGLIEPGPLFIANRNTDRQRYWPHHTLRIGWQLAHWIDPVRLRLEWLNVMRNPNQYEGDPLAPSLYRPDAIFATVMMFAPLGWFRMQNLPTSYFDEAAPLIVLWKAEREAMQNGAILPVGQVPDGVSWTGFVSISAERRSGYALIFRELNASADCEIPIPLLYLGDYNLEILSGEGHAFIESGNLQIHIPEKLRYLWVRFEAK